MMNTRIPVIVFCLCLLGSFTAHAQLDEATMARRQARKNLVIKEWNTDARTRLKVLDHITKYNDKGEKTEEIEYNAYGMQVWRETYKYGENGKIVENLHYDAKDKLVYVRKYEYNADNTKCRQLTYSTKGVLQVVKQYDYSYEAQSQ